MRLNHVASLWAATAITAPDCPALTGDMNADVVVIGAGFTGLRAALHLSEAGSRVVVVDSGDVGWGASGRNGGQVNPLLPFNSPDKVRRLVGPKYFERLAAVSLASADEVFELIDKYKIDCQARQNGWLRVDHSRKAQRAAIRDTRIWESLGADVTLVDGDELRRLSGSRVYLSGTIFARGGAVQPLSLARGIAAAAQKVGARIFGATTVQNLARKRDKWRVTTDRGIVSAEWVVVTTNGYTGNLVAGLAKSILPVSPIQIATEPLSNDRIETILPGGQTISDTRRIIMYARREPDGRMVFGGHGRMNSGGGFSGFDWLIADAERIYPVLKGVDWTYRWGGNIAVTDDRLPHLHEPQKGIIAGLGYNGRGVAMSNVMGRCIAERILGADPRDLPFPVSRIAPIPFRDIQVKGIGVAVSWMRFLDRVESRPSSALPEKRT